MGIFVIILLLIIACMTLKGVALGIAIGILGGALVVIAGLFIFFVTIWGRG